MEEQIKIIEDAISAILQAVKCIQDGESQKVNIDWLVSSCTELNEVKIQLECMGQ